jgi:hypothetical protein
MIYLIAQTFLPELLFPSRSSGRADARRASGTTNTLVQEGYGPLKQAM